MDNYGDLERFLAMQLGGQGQGGPGQGGYGEYETPELDPMLLEYLRSQGMPPMTSQPQQMSAGLDMSDEEIASLLQSIL